MPARLRGGPGGHAHLAARRRKNLNRERDAAEERYKFWSESRELYFIWSSMPIILADGGVHAFVASVVKTPQSSSVTWHTLGTLQASFSQKGRLFQPKPRSKLLKALDIFLRFTILDAAKIPPMNSAYFGYFGRIYSALAVLIQ